MKNFKDTLTAGIGTIISAIGTSLQPNEILEMISLIITIIGAALTLLMSLYTWWKNAKKDGKIDKEEFEDGVKIVTDGLDEIKNTIKKGEEDESKGNTNKNS